MSDTRSWSRADLYHLFDVLRRSPSVHEITFFISCFHHCESADRRWILERIAAQQRCSDMPYRIIVSTSCEDDLPAGSFDGITPLRINLSECSALHKNVQEQTDTIRDELYNDFRSTLTRKHPTYQNSTEVLEGVIEDCLQSGAPYLGRSILRWLAHFSHGMSEANITKAIRMLSPATPQNVMRTFIAYLPGHLDVRWAKSVIHLIQYAAEPWTPEALAEALAVQGSPRDDAFGPVEHASVFRDIENAFCGLVTTRGRNVRFAHDSLYDIDFFHSSGGEDDDHEASIHGELATICLRYLCSREAQERVCSALPSQFQCSSDSSLPLPTLLACRRRSLMEYAVRFWPLHYRSSASYKPLDLVLKLFRNQEARGAWEMAHYTMSNPFTRIERTYRSPLPVFAMLGLKDLVDASIAHEISLPFSDGDDFERSCWFAITEAARSGNQKIAQSLLRIVDVDQSELSEAIFWAASRDGADGVLDDLFEQWPPSKLKDMNFDWPEHVIARAAASGLANNLLHAVVESGHDMDALCAYWTAPPLFAALWWDQKDTVAFLLGLGVKMDLKASSMSSNTMLEAAMIRGNRDVTEMLLETEAQLSPDIKLIKPLWIALSQGAFIAVELLLQKARSQPSGKFFPVTLNELLKIAVKRGCEQSVRMLLANGADASTTWSGSRPLILKAAENNKPAVVRILLQKMDELGHVYENKEALLTEAVYHGDLEMASWLIEHHKHEARISEEDSHHIKALPLAAASGDLDMIRILVAAGADTNFALEDAPLSLALMKGRREAVRLLLEMGANVLWAAPDGYTALHAALHFPEIIPDLIRHGARVNARSEWGDVLTVFVRDCRSDNMGFRALVALINHAGKELDVNAICDDRGPVGSSIACYVGFAPLHIACERALERCVEVLLVAGADPDLQTRDGETALSLCLRSEEKDSVDRCVRRLLARRPNVLALGKYKNTILHGLGILTPVTAVELLIRAGAPVDLENEAGETPLVVAIEAGNVRVAEYLVTAAKVRVNLLHPRFGSILHLACKQGHQKLVRLMIDAKADPSSVHRDFDESLLYAALDIRDAGARARMVKYLVDDVKLDVNSKGGRFKYPIIRAAAQCGPEEEAESRILEFLIRRGADVDVSDEQGRTAVHLAAASTRDRGLRLLLDGKPQASANAVDKFGRMPIHFAAASNSANSIRFLLREGFVTDVNVQDSEGWTPLHWAARSSKDPDVFKELLDRKADVWARGRYGDDSEDVETFWSPLRLANFSNWGSAWMLEPAATARERIRGGRVEVWDDAEHKSRRGHLKRGECCWGCLVVSQLQFWVHPAQQHSRYAGRYPAASMISC